MSLEPSGLLSSLLSLTPLVVPLVFFTAGIASRRTGAAPAAWHLAAPASLLALIASVGFWAAATFAPFAAHPLLQASPLAALLQVLASFIAFVVIRYSRTSMATEPAAASYLSWLQLTLAAVSMVLVSNHMLVLLAAWVCISLCLHQLLMFFPERPRAALAAHKKFLFARVAELCLLTAFLLLQHVHGSWLISDVLQSYPPASLGVAEHIAMTLIVLAALIKCAQLPIHGWLIQVVEAPTPVSALLHGGIINLGGFLLILFGPLLVLSAPAQWLALVVGGLTVLLAALIMTTRISVKVRLAWSTSAQMGLMLVECALGLFELALLHLLAHSCYKAHAFLSAGNAVAADVRSRLAPVQAPSGWRLLRAGLLAAAVVAGALWCVYLSGGELAGPWSPWWLLALALATLLLRREGSLGAGSLLRWLSIILVTVAAYIGLKQLMAGVVPAVHTANVWADLWVAALFTLIFVGYYLQAYFAHLPWVNHLNIRLYAGLYLDEWATRATLAVWPVRLPVRMHAKQRHVIEGEV